jgi:hypothetical protein
MNFAKRLDVLLVVKGTRLAFIHTFLALILLPFLLVKPGEAARVAREDRGNHKRCATINVRRIPTISSITPGLQ